MAYYLVRAIFVLLFTFTCWKLGETANPIGPNGELASQAGTIVGIIFGVAGSVLLVGFEAYFGRYYLTIFYSVITGLLMGLLVSVFFVQIIAYIPKEYIAETDTGIRQKQIIGLLITTFVCYLSVVLVLRARNKYRLVIPFVELKQEGPRRKRLLLDTSVIIDGRIGDIAETSLLDQMLYLPDFVLADIHRIADSPESVKRSRGRRGLDMLNKLRTSTRVNVEMMSTSYPESLSSEARLIQLAGEIDGRILTTDNNLHRLAQLQGIEVVNLHDLENALRPLVIVGEQRALRVIRTGEEPDQGVGYLEDGTMVVVKGGRNHLGQEVMVTVTSVLQKQTGRMIFANLASDASASSMSTPRGRSGRSKSTSN